MEKETKIASLIELIKEDRIEVREIRNRMYSTIQLFVIASIAITAFGLDWKCEKRTVLSEYLYLVEIFFGIISWVYFFLTLKDLSMARECLKGRQDQLTSLLMTDAYIEEKVKEYNELIIKYNMNESKVKKLITIDDYKNNFFLDYSQISPDIKDKELFSVIGIATLIYLALMIGAIYINYVSR